MEIEDSQARNRQLGGSTTASPSRGGLRASRQFAVRAEGWCYLAVLCIVFLGALIRDINLLMLLFGFLTGPLLYSLWYCNFALRRLEVRRRLPKQIHAGEPFEVEIELRNCRRWRAAWAVLVHDHVRFLSAARDEPAHDVRLMFLYVAADSSVRLRYQVQMAKRGRYAFGPLLLSTRFPLGLFRKSRAIPDFEQLVVWPRLGRLTGKATKDSRLVDDVNRQRRRRHGILEGDFYGLRDWRPGDSRRWIHWRTSARTSQLMVRLFEQDRVVSNVVILDLWQPAQPKLDQLENVELAVSFAATLAADICRRGNGRLLVAIAGQADELIRGSANGAMLKRCLDRLATTEPTSEEHLPDVLGQAIKLAGQGTYTILLSTRSMQHGRLKELCAPPKSPRVAAWLKNMVCVSTDSARLDDFFEAPI